MRQRRNLTFVLHGARAERAPVRHLIDWVRARGHAVEPRVTWRTGDAEAFAREAVTQGADTVVALGGDGTVNEVANAVARTDTALGIIPLGTANDLARQLGIPADVDHAMDVILRCKARRIDAPTLNGRRFLNASVGGVGAEATAETPTDAKAQLGALAYAITGVRKLATLRPLRARFEAPGFEYDGEFVVFAVGNGRATGGGTMLTPHALLDDGLLDVCVVEAMPPAELARLALRMKRGEHLGATGVHYAQVPRLRVTAAEAVAVNADGEPQNASELEYEAGAGAVLVHAARAPGDDAGPG
ncbi:MAG TPA: YegS/Rv2252/BmrU family lipid kinase [Gemmatimonadaceae bacterium]|nr:YegS/Rv2252/BmrU family lipid kinase [Gemmatimonadaceae bacterium]